VVVGWCRGGWAGSASVLEQGRAVFGEGRAGLGGGFS